MDATAECVHATAIAAGGRAALIRGPSGSGKSDLALRCLAVPPSALWPGPVCLVSDDQVLIEVRTGKLFAAAPATITGRMEVRGLGVITLPAAALAPGAVEVCLIVDLLVAPERPERLPDPWPTTALTGVSVPCLQLDAREASAPLKVLLALAAPSLPAGL